MRILNFDVLKTRSVVVALQTGASVQRGLYNVDSALDIGVEIDIFLVYLQVVYHAREV